MFHVYVYGCYLFSRTENLVLTITGRMNEKDLFNTLRKTEEKVLRKRSIQGCEEFIRPWTSPIENLNLTEDFIYEIEYPSEDETLGKMTLPIRVELLYYWWNCLAGSIAVAWRLDQSINENIEMLEAYKLIMKYLTNTQVSPFEVAFVENCRLWWRFLPGFKLVQYIWIKTFWNFR